MGLRLDEDPDEWSFEVQAQNVTLALENYPAKVTDTKYKANVP